jgi:hypothetical protein
LPERCRKGRSMKLSAMEKEDDARLCLAGFPLQGLLTRNMTQTMNPEVAFVHTPHHRSLSKRVEVTIGPHVDVSVDEGRRGEDPTIESVCRQDLQLVTGIEHDNHTVG